MQFFTVVNRIYSETGFMKEQRNEKNGLYSCDELENIIKKYGDRQEKGYLTELVQDMPEKYRTVIHLFYYEGYSIKEIALMLGKKRIQQPVSCQEDGNGRKECYRKRRYGDMDVIT